MARHESELGLDGDLADFANPKFLAVIKRPLIILGMLSLLILLGTVGFRLVAETSWLESLYLSVVTLTTLGSRDPASNDVTMFFVVIYMALGLGLFSYSLFSLGQSLFDTEIRRFWRRRNMLNRIKAMRDHHIICGQGRMGLTICRHLANRNKPFVVIDQDAEKMETICGMQDWPYIIGDATDDENLMHAGIQRARSLASVLNSDADNVYVVLSARMLNSEIQIVARASDDKAIQKMERAGATRVISPFSSGGLKMARYMLNPSMESFVEVADNHDSDLELVDFQLSDDSPYIGKTLSQTNFGDKGVMILGIVRHSGERLVPPKGSTRIEPGDNLFAFGKAEIINEIVPEDAIL